MLAETAMWLLLCALLAVSAEDQPKAVKLPDNALVHRPHRANDRVLFAALAETVAVVADLPQDSPRDLSLLAKKFTEAAGKPAILRQGASLAILSAGPMLDGPDKVLVKSLTQKQDRIELEILHTAVRSQGARLRRNIRWRPLVEIPLQLPAGHYQVMVTWRAVVDLPEGEALKTPPRISSVKLEIRAEE